MTCSVTKATPIQLINGNCHIKKWKCRKTALSGYYACCSCDLLLKPLGVPTLANEMISRNQLRTDLWPVCAWFKNDIGFCHVRLVLLGKNDYNKPDISLV